MRVAFLGNAAWSVPSLEALSGSGHDLSLVLTRTPKPAGRGNRLTPTAVAAAARRLALPLLEVPTVKAGPGFVALAQARPDVLAVVAYGEILPKDVLQVPSVVPVNVHFSLLPELRGAAPVQRAILEGMTVTGVTTIRMDEGMDTGPILLQAEEAIDPEDDARTLGERLAAIGGRLLVDTLDRLEAGVLQEQPQDETLATYAPKLTPEDRVIVWDAPASFVIRQVLALAPEPAAETTFRGRRLKVYRAREASYAEASITDGWHGEIIGLSKAGPVVSTGHWPIVLTSVAPEGRRQISGGDFVRGYRPKAGELLG
jgi:methionyl-tRNA formyltransferase